MAVGFGRSMTCHSFRRLRSVKVQLSIEEWLDQSWDIVSLPTPIQTHFRPWLSLKTSTSNRPLLPSASVVFIFQATPTITGSPAGLSRANGDGQCSATMVTSTTHQSHNYVSFYFKFRKGDYVPRINNFAKFCYDRITGGAPTLWWNIEVACLILLFFCLFFSFLVTHTAHTREPIFTNDSSKDAIDVKKNPQSKCFSKFWHFGVIFLENHTNFAGSREIAAKRKMSKNS